MEKVIKVGSATNVGSLASSINQHLKEAELSSEQSDIVLRAIGAGALNQAIKASIVSNEHLVKDGYYVVLAPRFKKLENNTTSIELKIIKEKI